MFAWAHSSLSLNANYLLGSINHGIQRLYHDSDTLTRSSTFSEDIHPSAAPINHASNLLPAPTTVHKSADNNPTKRITLSALPNPLEKNNLDAQKKQQWQQLAAYLSKSIENCHAAKSDLCLTLTQQLLTAQHAKEISAQMLGLLKNGQLNLKATFCASQKRQ